MQKNKTINKIHMWQHTGKQDTGNSYRQLESAANL